MKSNFTYALLGVLVLLIATSSCEEYEELGEVPTRETHVHAKTVSFSELQNQTQIRTRLYNISLNQSVNNDLAAKSSMSGITIDTTQIKVMTYAQTHTYTFRLKRDVPLYYIENIVLHYNLDTQQYDEYLIQYDVSSEDYVKIDQGLYHETDPNVLITRLQNGTFADLQKSGCEPQCTTVMVPCTGDGHEVGEDCCVIRGDCPDTNPPVVGAYAYQSCQTVCGGNPDEDEDLDDGTPNNGGGAPPPADEDILTNPNNYPPCIDEGNKVNAVSTDGCYELELDDPNNSTVPSDPAECAKINAIAKSTSPANVDFMNELLDLHNNDLGLNHENGSATFTNTNVARTYQGIPNDPGVPFPDAPANDYTTLAHTHPNIGSGTLSIFSANDLAFAAKMMELGHAVDDFTLYLTTSKGTQYALTISDKQKFIDLFYSQIYKNFSDVSFTNLADLQTKEAKFENARIRYDKLFYKYFDPQSGLIKETDTNNEGVLTEFLNFINEADAGVKLFDASPTNPGDPPFQKFREIELVNGQPSRKNPC